MEILILGQGLWWFEVCDGIRALPLKSSAAQLSTFASSIVFFQFLHHEYQFIFARTPKIHIPYYLHPGENLVTALVSLVLDSTNYSSWS